MTVPGAILDAIVASIAPASTSAAASASGLVARSLSAGAIDQTPHSQIGSAARPATAGAIDQTPHSQIGSAALPGTAGVIDQTPHSQIGSAARPATAGAIDQTPHSQIGSAALPGTAGVIERLAGLLGGAQDAVRPSAKQRFVVVVAGDHGYATPGDTGPRHPTVVAAHAIASGTAALTRVARMSETSMVLVNAGAAEPGHFPNAAISLVPRPDLAHGSAMSLDEAYGALEAGIALSVSLSERALNHRTPSLALLAVGAIGEGADVAAAALLNAAAERPTSGTGAAALVARSGSPQIGVLAGLMLGAASMRIPVILDSYATGAAALVAAAIAPNVTGYLIPAHSGSHSMSKILAHLGLVPLFEVGLGSGDGTGAAMIVPLADHVAALAREPEVP